MQYNLFLDTLRAYFYRYLPNPFGRDRKRYHFYELVKNRDLILKRKIRHSGVTLPLNLGDFIQYWMFMEGAYEKKLIDFLLPYVKDRVFFDVGANIGSYTMSLSKAANRIYSFEASHSNAALLNSFVEVSGTDSVEVVNRAVSSISGEQFTIYLSPDTGGNNTAFCDFGKGCEIATTISLDQFVTERGIERVDVIKMDIEGSELAAFRGAHDLLSVHHPLLLVEFHSLVAKQAGWKLPVLYDLLVDYGYSVYELQKGKLSKFDRESLSSPEFYANLIFLYNKTPEVSR